MSTLKICLDPGISRHPHIWFKELEFVHDKATHTVRADIYDLLFLRREWRKVDSIPCEKIFVYFDRTVSKVNTVASEWIPISHITHFSPALIDCFFSSSLVGRKIKILRSEIFGETFDKSIEKVIININIKDNSYLLLKAAAIGGDIQFIQENIDLTVVDEKGLTFLHLAAKEGQDEVVRFLLQQPIDIRAQTRRGDSAFHLAVSGGSITAMCTLLESKLFPINERSKLGLTPLHIASISGSAKVIRFLLAQNDIEVQAEI